MRADERQRIGQREDDEVVLVGRAAHERATVVDVDADPRILVDALGMEVAADLGELRVDLDRVDVRRAVVQRQRDVRAAAGADDQDVVEVLVREPAVDLAMEQAAVRLGAGHHLLVRDAVDREEDRLVAVLRVQRRAVQVRLVGRDPVVRRPDVLARVTARLTDRTTTSDHREAAHRRPERRARAEREEQQQHARRSRTRRPGPCRGATGRRTPRCPPSTRRCRSRRP